MPRKRRAEKRTRFKITPEAIEAFRAGDQWALHRALGLKLWEINPLTVGDDEPCPYPLNSGGYDSWPQAVELRRALQEAL